MFSTRGLNRFSLHCNMICYLHFKFNHLLLFKEIIHNECLDEIWIQIVHYYFRSINLEHKGSFRNSPTVFIDNFTYVILKLSGYFYFPFLLKIKWRFEKYFTTNVCHTNLFFLEIWKKYLSFKNWFCKNCLHKKILLLSNNRNWKKIPTVSII